MENLEVFLITKKTKLNFRFHNPNTVEETIDYIEKIFIEVNKAKMDKVLQEEQNVRSKRESQAV